MTSKVILLSFQHQESFFIESKSKLKIIIMVLKLIKILFLTTRHILFSKNYADRSKNYLFCANLTTRRWCQKKMKLFSSVFDQNIDGFQSLYHSTTLACRGSSPKLCHGMLKSRFWASPTNSQSSLTRNNQIYFFVVP